MELIPWGMGDVSVSIGRGVSGMGEDRDGIVGAGGDVGRDAQGANKMSQGTEVLGDLEAWLGPGTLSHSEGRLVWRAPQEIEDEDIAKRMRLLSAGRSAFMLVGGAKTILLHDQKWNQGESYLA